MKRVLAVLVALGIAIVGVSAGGVTASPAAAHSASGLRSPAPVGSAAFITSRSSEPARHLPAIALVPPHTGLHGYPYDMAPQVPSFRGFPAINLSAAGYVEREFLMSGITNIYRRSGRWLPNGDWKVSIAQRGVPYTTRLLVRYPSNAVKFNGTVVIEWLNDTTGGDQDPVWAEVGRELVTNGYAYVGVTVQRAGMGDLRAWDPLRYGALGDRTDGQSYDIFTQTAQVIRAVGTTLLGALHPSEIVAMGDSQSALRLDTYVNAFQPLYHAYNGFITVGRAVVAAPLGNGLFSPLPFPARVRSDNTTPLIEVNSQGNLTEFATADSAQPDTPYLRTWDVSGAAHIDSHEAAYELETIYNEQPNIPVPVCSFGTPIDAPWTPFAGSNEANNMPSYEVQDAAVADMQKWLVEGVPAPSERTPVAVSSLGPFYRVHTNRYGLASGGVRLPEAQVPTEKYSMVNVAAPGRRGTETLLQMLLDLIRLLRTGSVPIDHTASRVGGLCALSGHHVQLAASTLRHLYPTHADYVAKYISAVHADEAAGFLTRADGDASIAAAKASSIP